jgi:hypothetical protein
VHGKRKEAGTVQEDWGRKGMAAAPTTSGDQGQDVEGEVHGKERAAATMDRRRAGGRWRGASGGGGTAAALQRQKIWCRAQGEDKVTVQVWTRGK